MVQTQPVAVLFDFDGTLVDTEPYWTRGRVEMLSDMGVAYSMEQSATLRGLSRDDSQAAIIQHLIGQGIAIADIDDDALYDSLIGHIVDQIERLGAPWRAGVPALLDDLEAKGVPCAIVSASPPAVINAGLKSLRPGVISVVVSGDEVARGKPDPEGYLLAATRLGVNPEACVVIEDSAAGAESGRAAGAVVIAVPDYYELADAPGQVVLPTLEGVGVAQLRQLFKEARRGE